MKVAKTIIAVLIITVSLLIPSKVTGQSDFEYFKGNYKKIFLEAESFFLYEDYLEAMYLYKLLKQKYEGNYAYDYRIGQCLLNISGWKHMAIPYLERAAAHTSIATKDVKYGESTTPVEAYFTLGNAYLIDSKIDKAIEYFNLFIEYADPATYDVEVARKQIRSSEYAIKLLENPHKVSITYLPEAINNNSPNVNAVVSADEKYLVYVTKLKFYDAIYYCEKKSDGTWTEPFNIIPQLGVDGNCFPTSISTDGKEIYFYRAEEYGGEIWISKKVDSVWTEIKALNKYINTKYWESHACISQDGKSLFFSSNRVGGYGGLDIYKSTKDAEGEWGPPVNAGPIINSTADEHTPFVLDNGKQLFFSSNGHETMGGFDIFYSLLDANNKYQRPFNLKTPLNTTDDDVFLCPVKDGNAAYHTVFNKQGQNREDIVRIEFNLQNLLSK